jgi:hypothetical protein
MLPEGGGLPCMALVVSSTGLGLPGSTPLGDTVLALRSSDAVDLGVAKLGLLGYPGTSPQPITLRLVENNAE